MKNTPNRSTITASTFNGEGALPLVIIGAVVIFIVVELVGAFAARTIATTWRSADQHAQDVDHVGDDDDQHQADHANDDGHGAVTKVNDGELNALVERAGD